VTEDTPAATLAAVVRLAIAATCRRYVGRCAEAVALRAQTEEEWQRVVDDCATAFARDSATRAMLHATAVAAHLMAEGDVTTAAAACAFAAEMSVEAWRAEVCGG
jgi:hypothetical protein